MLTLPPPPIGADPAVAWTYRVVTRVCTGRWRNTTWGRWARRASAASYRARARSAFAAAAAATRDRCAATAWVLATSFAWSREARPASQPAAVRAPTRETPVTALTASR
ncbi:hypothetical protein [Nocardioides panaciterrulae]|uniref:Uncharacterized protein n=1 Tax=Nocardioides panaciterrulae TaxID=661492 RepID=A0A7Y9E8W9_9ACTN|nr:hypothetical protein [Nocardioides panaciterrulae]NYD43278.1 hypothetical protein [Nocardioides panaciterrulae]